MKLYVGNLPDDVKERDIRRLFEKFGKIQEFSFFRFHAIVMMSSEDEALAAFKNLKDYIWMGKALQVQFTLNKSRNNSINNPISSSTSSDIHHTHSPTNNNLEKRNLPVESNFSEASYGTNSFSSASIPSSSSISHSSVPAKRHKTNKQNDFMPSQEAITYVKEEILNDPVARLMLLHDILAIMKKVNETTHNFNINNNNNANNHNIGANNLASPPIILSPSTDTTNQSFTSPLPNLILNTANHLAPSSFMGLNVAHHLMSMHPTPPPNAFVNPLMKTLSQNSLENFQNNNHLGVESHQITSDKNNINRKSLGNDPAIQNSPAFL